MKDLREKISSSMTRGVDPRAVMRRSLALGLAATLSALPYFHHLVFRVSSPGRALPGMGPWGLLAGQAGLLFLVCVLSAMVGLAFAVRQGLPGLGDPSGILEEWKGLVLLGAVMAAVSLVAFDQWFIRIVPAAYPEDAVVLATLPFKGALTEEVILRLCMVTLAVGATRRKWAGILIISLLAPLLTLKALQFYGPEGVPAAWVAVQIFLAFAAHGVLGFVFVTRGLLACMIVKFVFCLKYPAVSWLAG
jgi:hypothetical protein